MYFSTPIYYVNSDPHLGHAYTAILGDVLTRFYRQRSTGAFLLTGTDEHGEKIEQSARKAGLEPQAFVDQVSQRFRSLWPLLGVTPDDFIRTTEERHRSLVNQVLSELYASGDIYKGEYRGLYCTGCERYLTEKDLVQGLCPDHGVAPREVVEENYLFRMEQHREWLRAELERNPSLIEPERYRNEVLAILREPIGDLSISRPKSRVSWGIPMPFDPEHVVYVWFDALFNYVSGLGSPGHPLFERHWPQAYHLMAKDIVKQHGIFWPIMLHAARIPLFKGLRVHGYWLIDATKMSKSLGNVVRPQVLAEKYGVDALRYFLCRDMAFGSDADFSELALASRLNSDLANDLGNLLSRVLTMIQRYSHGNLPTCGPLTDAEERLHSAAAELPALVDKLVAGFQLNSAIEEILQVVRRANQYVQECAPWQLAKDPSQQTRVETILYHAAETLRLAAVLLYPIMPTKAVELLRQLGLTTQAPDDTAAWQRYWGHLPSGTPVQAGEVLFPKVDLAVLKAELAGLDAPPAPPHRAHSSADAAPTPKQPERAAPAPRPEPVEEAHAEPISIDTFGQIELRTAKVLHAEPVPKAKKLLKLTLEVGATTRTVVSGIAEHYAPDALVGKTVVMVFNLKPATLRGVESQGMILAAEDATGALSLVGLDKDVPSGVRVR